MFITSSDQSPAVVVDYDITFSNGLLMTITIDQDAGDTADIGDANPKIAKFHIAEKPSTTDPNITLPPEDIAVFLDHVVALQVRTRTVIQASPEDREAIKELLKELSTSKTQH